MGTFILILTKITILVIGIFCLIFPTHVIAIIYGRSKSVIDKFGMYDFVDPKTKEAYKLVHEDPEKFKIKYPLHIATVRITGIIFIMMFIFSLCGINQIR
jgi:hypothetical protein